MAKPSESLPLVLAAEESPDWGYARNRRVVLMGPSAEWVQSVYSCTWMLDGIHFMTPNRDYPYEGFLAHEGGENWKFIDCIALALRDSQGQSLPLEAAPASAGVRVTPWRATYSYRVSVPRPHGDGVAHVPLFASYYLCAINSPQLATAGLEIYLPKRAENLGLTLILQPFLDVRHMFAGSSFRDYQVHAEGQRLHVEYLNRRITFYLPPSNLVRFDSPQVVDWVYKLGTGSRLEVMNPAGQMETLFASEQRQIAACFRLEVPLAPSRSLIPLRFSCGLADAVPFADGTAVATHLRQSRRADRELVRQIGSAFRLPADLPFADALVSRIVGLTKFKSYVHVPEKGEHVKIPHAGAWWFRTPWYRDVFEGISTSFETLTRLPAERENVRQTVLQALRYQHPESGLIQARLPEFASQEPSYNSSDATLLCLMVAGDYARQTGDLDFVRLVLPPALRAIACFLDNHGRPLAPNDPPRLDPATGLLLSAPHHSWIDTQSQVVEYAGWRLEELPNRVSQRFVKDLYDALGDKEKVERHLLTPSFFLPEVNAQWLRVLAGVIEMIDRVAEEGAPGGGISRERLDGLLERARQSFKPLFWNEDQGFLYNLVDEGREIRDEIECEAAVTAAAMLGETIFTLAELRAVWRCAGRTLLVRRRPQLYGNGLIPFGLLTRNADQRVFYNDDHYHS
ncbi:MAG TPA: amylo-alpha-1,6-glucosidase, partial [Thermoanaerobaculia bacterium]|nr:amylo-alpha-1,6-glucosidase [Thermoanaerobaculia bacterium]